MDWTQIFLATALTVYTGATVAVMVLVKRLTGARPAGHARGHRPAALLNGIATVLLLLVAISYCLTSRSVEWLGRIVLLDHPVTRSLGAVMLVLSGVCIVWGEISLGRSFRVALPESKQTLVTHGMYRFTRNPLALSVDLLASGVLLLAPSWLALSSLILNLVSYEYKIRIEEAYLQEAHGAAYVAYCARTGRYFPKLFGRQYSGSKG